MKLRLVYAGLVGLLLAGSASAAANGNSGNDNASFTAVVQSVPGVHGGGVSILPASGTFGAGVGSAVSELATANGGITVAILAGGNPQSVPPVPEPDAYLMMLAGLGMVGVVARRRLKR